MNCSCRSAPARLAHLHAKTFRTFLRSQVCARASSFLRDLSLRCAGMCAPRPAIPARIRIPVRIALRVPCAAVAPAPDFALPWKSLSARLRAAPPRDNKSGSTPDRPPRCTKFLPPRIAETLRDSLAPKTCPPPRETRRTNLPQQTLEPAIQSAPPAPTPQRPA